MQSTIQIKWAELSDNILTVIDSVRSNLINRLPLTQDELNDFNSRKEEFMDEVRIASGVAVHIVSVFVYQYTGEGCGDCDADELLLNYCDKMEDFFSRQINNIDRIIKRVKKRDGGFDINEVLVGSFSPEECVVNLIEVLREEYE